MQLTGDELEQAHRGHVKTVDVVEHEHERAGAGELVEQRGDPIEQTEPQLLGLAANTILFSGLIGGGQKLGEFGSRRHVGSLGGKLPSAVTQQLHPRPVRGCRDVVGARTPRHNGARRLREARELLSKTGLADPRLSRAQHQPTVPAQAFGQRVLEDAELGVAADERPSAHRRLACHAPPPARPHCPPPRLRIPEASHRKADPHPYTREGPPRQGGPHDDSDHHC